jgi:glycine/serine hydroxymethyltransferase
VAEQITEAARYRREQLVDDAWAGTGSSYQRAMERAFDALIMQVSDAAKELNGQLRDAGFKPDGRTRELLAQFILPEPVDPLVEALEAIEHKAYERSFDIAEDAKNLRDELAKRGLKIVPSNG